MVAATMVGHGMSGSGGGGGRAQARGAVAAPCRQGTRAAARRRRRRHAPARPLASGAGAGRGQVRPPVRRACAAAMAGRWPTRCSSCWCAISRSRCGRPWRTRSAASAQLPAEVARQLAGDAIEIARPHPRAQSGAERRGSGPRRAHQRHAVRAGRGRARAAVGDWSPRRWSTPATRRS